MVNAHSVSRHQESEGLATPRPAFSVRSWCRKTGICPATFYNHVNEMPATIKIGRRTIITAEADEEWRLRMERKRAVPRAASRDNRAL